MTFPIHISSFLKAFMDSWFHCFKVLIDIVTIFYAFMIKILKWKYEKYKYCFIFAFTPQRRISNIWFLFTLQSCIKSRDLICTRIIFDQNLFFNWKYTVFNLCRACLNGNGIFLIEKIGFNGISKGYLCTKNII